MPTSSPVAVPSTPCPSCGEDARLAANPYYGTGLSVHPHVVTCTHCGRLGFAPRADSGPADDAEATPAVRGPWRRLTAWLGAA
ncbi:MULTISPECIES: hypothetical protein [unclassified Frigoribacterium]|uniref:hypothetical protein n=1 Tax=unclassified Frigoribacterium TaxID=2627005 RepID=UPI0006F7FF04|nr:MULTISPECIES: hypothetical protein [unclassified Frigoribacterium]KQO81851.1 hypothetical protein ASF17_12160 [Frigoribacterium sp. Leaf263]KQR66200.1 hypothetical protein ASF89_03425 [Frigoribacterium sp. Leaf172]